MEARQTKFEYLGYQYRKNKTYCGKIYYRWSKYDSEDCPTKIILTESNQFVANEITPDQFIDEYINSKSSELQLCQH
ncbi:hypothetical protein HZS_3692 [Henneguya salminicola]|nr:hypothetical protein HZS_3692 [Henneguya salminicola]